MKALSSADTTFASAKTPFLIARVRIHGISRSQYFVTDRAPDDREIIVLKPVHSHLMAFDWDLIFMYNCQDTSATSDQHIKNRTHTLLPIIYFSSSLKVQSFFFTIIHESRCTSFSIKKFQSGTVELKFHSEHNATEY